MEFTLPWASIEAVLLAGVRFAAFLVIAPPFSHRAIPATVKAMLAVSLGLLVAPTVAPGTDPTDTAGFVGQLVMQAVIGAALGFLVYLAFAAIQSAGSIIDLFAGFQIAQAYDPGNMTQGAQFQRLYQFTAIVLLFASDGYQLVILGLARTFDVLPIGQSLPAAAMAAVSMDGLTQMFIAALQIAGPLIVVLFLADVGLGLLTRVAPSLNAFALGFPLKILLTLTLIGMVYLALPRLVSSLVDAALVALTGVTQ